MFRQGSWRGSRKIFTLELSNTQRIFILPIDIEVE